MPTMFHAPSRRRFVALAAAGATAGLAGPAMADARRQSLVNESLQVAAKILDGKDLPDARKVMARAKAVMILPSVAQAAFIVGGSGGRGVLLAKSAPKDWSHPAFYTMGSGSLGLQIGGRVQELLLIVLTDKGLNSLIDSKFKFGAGAGMNVVSAGIGVGADTTAAVGADIVSFSAGSGLYVGASLEGSYLDPDTDWNALYYGTGATTRAIVIERRFSNPGANALRQYLSKF